MKTFDEVWQAEQRRVQRLKDVLLFEAIITERLRQNELHHGGSHERKVPLTVMIAVLTEEVGEAARALLHAPTVGREDLRQELIQVAAVAIQTLEGLDDAPLGVAPEFAG